MCSDMEKTNKDIWLISVKNWCKMNKQCFRNGCKNKIRKDEILCGRCNFQRKIKYCIGIPGIIECDNLVGYSSASMCDTCHCYISTIDREGQMNIWNKLLEDRKESSIRRSFKIIRMTMSL